MTAPGCDNLWREAVETLPMVTYLVSSGPSGRTEYISPQIEDLLGYPVQDWLDDPDFFEKVVHPADRGNVPSQTEARTVTEDSSALFRVVAADGREVTVQSELVVKRDEQGRPTHVFGFWIDATERVKLSTELRQAQKLEALGRLAGGVAHDFNNLLLAQQGYGELALRYLEHGDVQAAQHALREILDTAGRGGNLTGQLLAFARRQAVKVEAVDLNAVVAELDHLLRILIGDSIVFRIQAAERPVWVQADRGQLEQVLINLVVNARDAMPAGGVLIVSVGTAESGRTAVLEVADTGLGMDSATAERIFDPYFTTKGADGTGLGLATVHGIVTQLGGDIGVASTPDVGTRFTVRVPTAERPTRARKPETLHPRGNHETILVLDDDPAVRGAVAAMLELNHYRVHAVADADEALEVVSTLDVEIALLVTDVVLRSRSGPAAAQLIRELRPGLAVLYMSGHTEDTVMPELGSAARASFIQKPFSAAELAHAVAELLHEGGG